MKEKFIELVKGKCKDMGLSTKSVDEIIDAFEVKDGMTDEELETLATMASKMAKATQAEVTRKLQDAKAEREKAETALKAELEKLKEGKTKEDKPTDEIPEWAKQIIESQKKQEERNAKEDEAKKALERSNAIKAKIKELQIPTQYAPMLEKAVANEEDFTKALTEFKDTLNKDGLDGEFGGQRGGGSAQLKQEEIDKQLEEWGY